MLLLKFQVFLAVTAVQSAIEGSKETKESAMISDIFARISTLSLYLRTKTEMDNILKQYILDETVSEANKR